MKRAWKILSKIVLIASLGIMFSFFFTTEAKAAASFTASSNKDTIAVYDQNIERVTITEHNMGLVTVGDWQKNSETAQGKFEAGTYTFTIGIYILANIEQLNSSNLTLNLDGQIYSNPELSGYSGQTGTWAYFDIPVTITAPTTYRQVTFNVANGKWNDNTSNVLYQWVEDRGYLTAEQIPDVGNNPNGGYRAGGWDTVPTTGTQITSNTTYTYSYQRISVTFDANGGQCSTTSSQVGDDGKLASLPRPSWEGHDFDGWYDGDNRVDETEVYTADTNLVAHWSYNPVFQSASIDAPSRVVKGQSYTIPVTFTFNRGLTVNDYADVAGKCSVEASPDYKSSNPRHSAGNNNFFLRLPITIPSDSTSENLTIRAKYNGTVEATATIPIDGPAPTNHTVTYKVVHGKWNDGSTGTKSETVADNAHLAHIPSVGSKPDDGYKAGSWSPSTPSSSTAITEDIEYTYTYASESAKTYTVTTSDDGHGSAKASPTSGETGTKVTITATPDKDHQFKEWKVIKGGVELADKKKKVTTFNIKDSNVEVKAIFDEEEDDDDDEDDEDHTPSWVLNPNEKQQLVITFAGNTAGLTAGYQEQGEVAQGLFKKETPAGYQKAFSFNILKDGKPDYSLKKGTLTLIIPPEYRKAGRQFAILAMGRNGQVIYLPDSDTDPNTVTVSLNLEGYALQLIYND